MDLSLLKNWGGELEMMNRGKVGRRYHYPWSLIRLLCFLHIYLHLPYRQCEGFARALTKLEKRLKAPDYTTLCRRVNSLNLDLDPKVKHDSDMVIAVDASGIKVTNSGEWIRRKWKARRGYLKIHLAVDVKTKQILALKVTDERVGDGKMLKPLVEEASHRAKVIQVLGDGGYDSKDNFHYLDQKGIEPAIKVRSNSSGRTRGCRARGQVAREYLENPEGWKHRVGYSSRWMAETAFSSLKRLFGEYATAKRFTNMVKEMILKATLYNLFISLNP